jgi:anthranilate phosphoribosyltransferase
MKGESADEIASFATSVRSHGIQIRPNVSGRMIDTCGTGGDKVKTFNVSTISAFVAAGAGVVVAKHGNRSVSSKCGSADLLERIGFNLSMEPDRIKESIEKVGIGFMFAPVFHPAMKKVAPIRKEMGVRTIFNLIGPLMNPANVNAQLVGVYAPSLTSQMAKALQRLGKEEAIVIHGLEGMDEISVSGKTQVSWLRDGEIITREYEPREFGVERAPNGSVEVASIEEGVSIALDILGGNVKSARADMVLANAAAAVVLGKKAKELREGMVLARESLSSGAAEKKLEELIGFSGGDLSRIESYGKRA